MRTRWILLLSLAAGALPRGVHADWRAFVPSPVQNEIFLDLLTQFERDRLRGAGDPVQWDDLFVKEKIVLSSNGYSYSPRFLLYQLSLGGALSQEQYDASHRDVQGWKRGSGLEYSFRLSLLPEHPYNLVLFSSRNEPVFKEHAATRRESVGSTHGATFRFRRNPYFLNASVVDTSVESGRASSDITNFDLNGQYFKEFDSGDQLSFSGDVNPSRFSNSLGLEGSSTEAHLDGFVNFRQRARLSSSLARYASEQQSELSGRLESGQLSWTSLLNATLPWNFRTDVSYRYQDSDSTLAEPGTGGSRELSDLARDLQVGVAHKLYQSLGTTYTFLHAERSSSGGSSTTLSHALALSYTKTIPRGHIVAGLSRARVETDSRGQGTDVVNEAYPGISVPTQAFVLNRANVRGETIAVFLESPLEPFETILLVRDEHYLVRPLANLDTFEIQVFSLPPQFSLPGTYDFLVSYSLEGGDFEARTDAFGANLSVQLFENFLAPYVAYSTVGSDVLSGQFPGTPVDSSTYTAGLRMTLGGLRARGEYQELDWELAPSRSWMAELQYVGALGASTRAFATASYLDKRYPQGRSLEAPTPFTELRQSISASVQQRLRSANMFLSAGGSYSRVEGLVDSDAYSLSASWNWTVGKLDLSAGASAYVTETSGAIAATSRRDHEYFFLRLRRKLF